MRLWFPNEMHMPGRITAAPTITGRLIGRPCDRCRRAAGVPVPALELSMRKKLFKQLRLGKPERLTAGLISHEHPAVSPDGRLIAYYAGLYGSIEVIVADISGRFGRVVSPLGGNSTQPAWHPRGQSIAYRHQHSNDSKWELWQTTLTGEIAPRVLLADSRYHYKHPYFSPSGLQLAYFSDEDSPGVYHIWIAELPDLKRRQVTFGNTQMHCHPVFSPDGLRIAFHAYEGTDESKVPAVTHLCELDLASGRVTQLTGGPDQDKHPFYADDDVLTYHHERNSDGRRQLCALHLPSLKIVELTDGSDNDKHPFPYADVEGRLKLAWASKKLGGKLPGEACDFDIFTAPLKA